MEMSETSTRRRRHRRRTSPRRVPTWFDRVNRYRVAAGFLFVPFLAAMVALIFGHNINEFLPMMARRSIYWVGLLLLTIALAMDWWEVYSGKREVKRRIEARLQEDEL